MLHARAVEAAQQMRPKLKASLEIGVVGDNKLILLQGPGAEVHAARELLRKIDVDR